MELIDQHTKAIMEGCKARARDAGLTFRDETLEYIVTNRDLLELSPKYMIPTLYDYWVHDLEVLKEKGKYELYPHNPYETVINTRPAISFYNDNNPDWLNVMIFYHVLAHIDFFQNNLFFQHTWRDDFAGQALADKRTIARLRSEKGRWVDYVIEFARGIDNLVSYFQELNRENGAQNGLSPRLNFYFDHFLQAEKRVKPSEYLKEVERYNGCQRDYGASGEQVFFGELHQQYPEFEALFQKWLEHPVQPAPDLLSYLLAHSAFLNKDDNRWMQTVIQIVRNTSLFFQPQIRTKIMNEGWASYWHERLFLQDDRIQGHEVDFARVNASVVSMPRVGLNPYALGMRLYTYIEQAANQGRYTYDFQRLTDARQRQDYAMATGQGQETIFKVRASLSDFSFIHQFVDQDFVDAHHLFVAGRRLNQQRGVWEYYIKSRSVKDYRQMLVDSLYHPPNIVFHPAGPTSETLYLDHQFEGRSLVTEFIPNTLMGVEYFWGGPVALETSEVAAISPPAKEGGIPEVRWQRTLYTMHQRKLTKKVLK